MTSQLYTLEMFRHERRLGSLMFTSPRPGIEHGDWVLAYCDRFVNLFHDWDTAELKAVHPGTVGTNEAAVLTRQVLVKEWSR